MTISLVDADNLLAVDVGSAHTRAAWFDVVEGRYRLVALGVAPTTAAAPLNDLREGLTTATEQLQQITGQLLLDTEARVLLSESDHAAVDQVVLTLSAGAPLRVALVGVLRGVSLHSARRLIHQIPSSVVAQLHLGDRMHTGGRVQALVQSRPDVVLIVGGVEGGATRSVLAGVRAVRLALELMPPQQRPEVIYAGNSRLHAEVQRQLEALAPLHLAPNLRPTLEHEQLAPAQEALLDVFRRVRGRQLPGLQAWLDDLSGRVVFYPTSYALARMVRFLGRTYDENKGVLAVDVGAESVTLTGAWGKETMLRVFTDLGVGSVLPNVLEGEPHPVDEVRRWVPFPIEAEEVLAYAYHKALYPHSVPATERALALALAFARLILRRALRGAWKDIPPRAREQSRGWLPPAEPILVSGHLLTHSASPAQALLTLLDGLQPHGVTTFVLDRHPLFPMLGAAAETNPPLAVQMLESHHFEPLATVLTVAHGVKRWGATVARVRVEIAGAEREIDVHAGTLLTVPLRPGQKAKVVVRPQRSADAGWGAGRRGVVIVHGSRLGLVIDARGRPTHLPPRPEQRFELQQRWLKALR